MSITKIWARNDCSWHLLSLGMLSSPKKTIFSGHFCPEKKNFVIKKHSEGHNFTCIGNSDICVHLSFGVEMTVEECLTWLGRRHLPREETHRLDTQATFHTYDPQTPTHGGLSSTQCIKHYINGPLSWVGLSWTPPHYYDHNLSISL